MNPSAKLVNRLWRLCAVLRKDGITYPQYVIELTYLIFLKMTQETRSEEGRIPQGCRWADLVDDPSEDMLERYVKMLARLSDPQPGVDRAVARIFAGARTVPRAGRNLQMLTDAINRL